MSITTRREYGGIRRRLLREQFLFSACGGVTSGARPPGATPVRRSLSTACRFGLRRHRRVSPPRLSRAQTIAKATRRGQCAQCCQKSPRAHPVIASHHGEPLTSRIRTCRKFRRIDPSKEISSEILGSWPGQNHEIGTYENTNTPSGELIKANPPRRHVELMRTVVVGADGASFLNEAPQTFPHYARYHTFSDAKKWFLTTTRKSGVQAQNRALGSIHNATDLN